MLFFYVTKFANKKIINIKISIINSSLKNSKSFKIKIYTNSKNIINIKINNKSQIYYNSEIIFYCQYLTTNNINIDNLEFCSHNLKYRKRLLICNFDEADFIKIINNNINNIDLQNKALNVIKSNYNQLLLINIYTGRNTANILIFKEKENKKPLIIPIKEEKNFFKNFYLEIYNNKDNINNLIEICEDYKEKLVNKKKIFNINISNLDDNNNINIYFSFINQGINCLLENKIISENSLNDYYFILGYMLFYAYIYYKSLAQTFVKQFFENIEKVYIRKYPFVDLIRIGVSYIIFSINEFNSLNLKLTDELKENYTYYKCIKFFKDIIKDLNEDSELAFIYLQIYSGYGLELINQEKCFKLSMISVEDIKYNIINNKTQYFYTYYPNKGKYFETDSITQVSIFNESKIFDYSTNNKENNNIMNITIGIFHESSHIDFHNDNDIDGNSIPINCINKNFEFIKKYCNVNGLIGDGGKFVDYFLYNSTNDLIAMELISSLRSNELTHKNIFIGNLDILNEKANNIIKENKKNNIEDNEINNTTHRNLIEDLELRRLEEIGCDIDY